MKAIKILLMAVLTILSAAAFAQNTTKQKMKMHKKMYMKYCCPMHHEITGDKPGKCSKCGMGMKKMEMAYCCPKHHEVISDKPGKCPKCGAALNLPPKEKMKMEVMKIYACPMHADVTSNKPGKCPKCSTKMKEKKE